MSNTRKNANKDYMPQTPKKDIATENQDLEIAEEVSQQYDLEVKPGFEPTAVNRKNK